MVSEVLPRLMVCLRSAFPDANIEMTDQNRRIRVVLKNQPSWPIEISARPYIDGFQFIRSEINLKYDCLSQAREADFLHLLSAENTGLRGVSLVAPSAERKGRQLRIQSSFLGQMGRTKDEEENLVINLLSLVRYARILEDRILRSSAGGSFSFEMYHSQYRSVSAARSRYVNYARSIFRGSADRVFGQLAVMLKKDHGCQIQNTGPRIASVITQNSELEIELNIPDEIPLITFRARLLSRPGRTLENMARVARLNRDFAELGHFELSSDSNAIFFATWKHLTNDLRYFSLDQLLKSVLEANTHLRADESIVSVLPEITRTQNLESDSEESAA